MTRRHRRFVLVPVLAAVIAACGGPAGTPAPTAPPTGSATSPATGSPAPTLEPSPGISLTPVPTQPVGSLAPLPPAEGVLNAVWLGGDRVVVAGFTGPGFVPAISVFHDGTWTTASMPRGNGQVSAIAQIDGRLFAVGDRLPDERTGFLWVSDDGTSWTEVLTVSDGALYDIAASSRAIVAVGAFLDQDMVATAAAWVSTNGDTWTPAQVADGERRPMGLVTPTELGWLAVGDRPLGETRPVWSAPDPTSWAGVDNDLGEDYLPVDLEGTADGRIVLVGASGRSGDQHPFVAVSADGSRWDQRLLDETAEGYASAIAVVRGTVLVAGVDADALTLFTPLEADVAAEVIEPMGASIGAMRWDPGWGLVGVGSLDGQQALWELPVS
jgi:hypothetical protein